MNGTVLGLRGERRHHSYVLIKNESNNKYKFEDKINISRNMNFDTQISSMLSY